MSPDAELLRRYANNRDEAAFTQLVRSYVGFVYAAALRQMHGNTALAQDVTQLVFTDLARKAATLARHEVLVGWLHTATRFAATKAMRAEGRRRAREHEAFAMNEQPDETMSAVDWQRVQPVLDDVLAALKERERIAILLRFFEGRPFAEIGTRLTLTESAARSCVDRALEKMRALLARRGVTSSGAALGAALANHGVVAAPAELVPMVASSALAGVASGGGAVFAWGTIFAMSKIKTVIITGAVIWGATIAVREVRAIRATEEQIAAARADQEDSVALRLENAYLAATVARTAERNSDAAELVRLNQRIAQLKARPDGVVDALMKPAAAWRNAGRATPTDAFETLQWSIVTGDREVLASLLAFNDAGKAKLDAFFAGLSPEARERLGTPERMIAAVNPSQPYAAFQILEVQEQGDKTVVRAWIREQSDRERRQDLVFSYHPDGWRAPLGGEQRAEAILAGLDPKTGGPRPKGN